MILLACLLIGALLGWRRAAALGGNQRDKLQYAAAYALALSVVGLFATIIIDRIY